MQKQFKLFKNIQKDAPKFDFLVLNKSNLVGVEYTVNSKNLFAITDSMTSQGFKQFFFTPRHLKHILSVSRLNKKIRINEIEFSTEPEYEVTVLLDAFYNNVRNSRTEVMVNNLMNVLYDNDAIKMSFYFMETVPYTKVNIYQSGLVHISNSNNNLEWLDELLMR